MQQFAPPHEVALQEDWFAYTIPPGVVREILLQNGIQRVWELAEGDYPNQYEIDVAFMVPGSSGLEHCWTSEQMDWLFTEVFHSAPHSTFNPACEELLLTSAKDNRHIYHVDCKINCTWLKSPLPSHVHESNNKFALYLPSLYPVLHCCQLGAAEASLSVDLRDDDAC